MSSPSSARIQIAEFLLAHLRRALDAKTEKIFKETNTVRIITQEYANSISKDNTYISRFNRKYAKHIDANLINRIEEIGDLLNAIGDDYYFEGLLEKIRQYPSTYPLSTSSSSPSTIDQLKERIESIVLHGDSIKSKEPRWKWFMSPTISNGSCGPSSILNAIERSITTVKDQDTMHAIRVASVEWVISNWDEVMTMDTLRELTKVSQFGEAMRNIDAGDTYIVKDAFRDVFTNDSVWLNIELGIRSISSALGIGILVVQRTEAGEDNTREFTPWMLPPKGTKPMPTKWCVLRLYGSHFEALYLRDIVTGKNHFWFSSTDIGGITTRRRKGVIDEGSLYTLDHMIHAMSDSTNTEADETTDAARDSVETYLKKSYTTLQDFLDDRTVRLPFVPKERNTGLSNGVWDFVNVSLNDNGGFQSLHSILFETRNVSTAGANIIREQIAARVINTRSASPAGREKSNPTENAEDVRVKLYQVFSQKINFDDDVHHFCNIHKVGIVVIGIGGSTRFEYKDDRMVSRLYYPIGNYSPAYYGVLLRHDEYVYPVYYMPAGAVFYNWWFTPNQISGLTEAELDAKDDPDSFHVMQRRWIRDHLSRVLEQDSENESMDGKKRRKSRMMDASISKKLREDEEHRRGGAGTGARVEVHTETDDDDLVLRLLQDIKF